MMSLLRGLSRLLQKRQPFPRNFPLAPLDSADSSEVLEEDKLHDFRKLGFGITSTVWLACDMNMRNFVALKIFAREGVDPDEVETYQKISRANPSHRGYAHVRSALRTFGLPRPDGDHACLVQEPMWASVRDLMRRNPHGVLSEDVLKGSLIQLLYGLDYLHTECKLVHTDLKADNMFLEINEDEVLDDFADAEMISPSKRKLVHGQVVYRSRALNDPRSFGRLVLGDFGSAVSGEEKHNVDAQPAVYRSPEVMVEANWSYPIDIWNVGAMIWTLFERQHLFNGIDPHEGGYMTRAHLAQLIALMGPPPVDLIRRGARSPEFFAADGKWIADVAIPQRTSLEEAEERLEGDNEAKFLVFVRKMLQWRPEDRATAKELLDDEWLRKGWENL